MKKIMSLMLGLSLVLGAVSIASAQDTTSKSTKKAKKAKKTSSTSKTS